jgi:hypothetical protein
LALAAVTIAAVLAAIASAVPAAAHVQTSAVRKPGTWCGGARWKLMTLSDRQRATVRWTPALTSIPAVSALTPPKRLPPRRNSPFERQVWQLSLVIERYRLASNGELVFELYDIPSSTYMNAYMPNPRCLSPNTRGRAEILAARSAFTRACKLPPTYWWPLGASVQITGVGYWNPTKTTLGALPNGAEIRPVTGFKLIDGCGKG